MSKINTMSAKTLAQLTQQLHVEIPLSREIGVGYKAYDGDELLISAPLTANINHKLSAFGGSIYSVAVLTGWALINLSLEEIGESAEVVIYQSNVDYIHAIHADFVASCQKNNKLSPKYLKKMLSRKPMFSVDLPVRVCVKSHLCALFQGKYVIHRRE